jgi:hypothetical protein
MTDKFGNGDSVLAWRIVCWVILTATVLMTTWPFDLAPEGPISTGISRVLCYAALAFSFALAYRRRFLFPASLPVACMCARELLPILVAGHHLDWPDTVRKGLGIVIGISIGVGVNWESQRDIQT